MVGCCLCVSMHMCTGLLGLVVHISRCVVTFGLAARQSRGMLHLNRAGSAGTVRGIS